MVNITFSSANSLMRGDLTFSPELEWDFYRWNLCWRGANATGLGIARKQWICGQHIAIKEQQTRLGFEPTTLRSWVRHLTHCATMIMKLLFLEYWKTKSESETKVKIEIFLEMKRKLWKWKSFFIIFGFLVHIATHHS